MYRKIVVPLDGSEEAEKVLPIAQNVLAPGGEVMLLHIIPIGKLQVVEGAVVYREEVEAADSSWAMSYLKGVHLRVGGDSSRWRCEVTVADSIAEGIADFAVKEHVNLIAMYTHDRKGLAKLIRGSIAEKVQRRVPVEVQVFRPSELVEQLAERASDDDEKSLKRHLLMGTDLLKGLSDEQIDQVASLAQRAQVPAGEVLARAGEWGDNLFIIVQGEAQVSARSAVGDITVRIAGPGESFPLAALLGLGILITSVRALTDMHVLKVPRHQLVTLCSQNPELGFRIYANIAEVFANRYSKTLTHLTLSAEIALEASIEAR